jgi:U3 small nucleolar RNA-associated protein 6
MSRKRPRSEKPPFHIPVLHDTHNLEDAFCNYQAVHIPKIALVHKRENTFKWTDIGTLFQSLEKDRPSWCVENGRPDILLPSDFFLAQTLNVGYGSFLLQKDTQVLEETLKRLPLVELQSTNNWSYEPCLWFFFGSNVQGKDDLQGRPEHTDSVSHDGTWHYQLSGSKRWYLRPTTELLETLPDATSVCIHVEQGDVLVINTRLWWHCTVISPQPNPSVSYARDFYMTSTTNNNTTSSSGDASSSMSNVDGLYAANDVEEGTLIFTQDDMPDCELPHSTTNPNCKVVELEDGTHALVSCRNILSGEFFCVADDSDQEDDDDSEES